MADMDTPAANSVWMLQDMQASGGSLTGDEALMLISLYLHTQ